jgi:DASH complex subunit DAD2
MLWTKRARISKNKRKRKGNKLEMSNYGRPLPSHLRNQSLGGAAQQSPVLLARIAEKKAELASLKDLQALSGGLADQMQMLADKLQTLSSGTEGVLCRPIFPTGSYWHVAAVAAVLSNWHNVLRAINMASSESLHTPLREKIKYRKLTRAAKIPRPKEEDDTERPETEPPLPQTLVRIPTQHAPAVIEQANAGAAAEWVYRALVDEWAARGSVGLMALRKRANRACCVAGPIRGMQVSGRGGLKDVACSPAQHSNVVGSIVCRLSSRQMTT